jgi:hypothetical protein
VALWRSIPRPQRVAAGVVLVLLGAVGFLPLFGGPGYEQSLASGLVVPVSAAIATALDVSSSELEPLACVGRGLGTGLGLALVAYLTALVHGLRVGICDLAGGSLLFALTAGMGGPLGGLWGAVVAERCRGRKRRRLLCVLLAIAGPLGGVLVSVARFYGSPMVFGYDPFFGYFSGALYDTVVDVRTELWTYRGGTLATLVGAVLFASALTRSPGDEGGRLALRSLRGEVSTLARLVLGLALLAGSLVCCIEGPALGHWQTVASIAIELGGRARGPRCDVIHPDSLLADQVTLLVRDCEQELAADEQRLGAHLDGRLTAFVFKDAEQKRRLMGAADTQIAKPWRLEVYVQMSGFPHPVLGHEIAHVVAGSFARGPFRVAGSLGGLWPNPGLIEGTAEATSPDDDELTDSQWARAMLTLGILPSIHDLFTVGFMGENSSKAYTVAAAFVAWVLDKWGPEKLRAWYGGGSIEVLTGETWVVIEQDFATWLKSLPLPEEALAYAKAKFDRPSVWGRRCPHVVDALDRRADRCREEHRVAAARDLYDAALERDPHDWHALFDRGRLGMWYGNEEAGRGELSAIAEDEHAPRTWRDRAQEAMADDDLARGRDTPAVEAYHALAARTLDEDAARTLEVKAMSVDNPPARRAIVDLLVGEPGRPVDTWLGALSLGGWAEETHEPLAGYLVGKNLTLREDWQRAAAWLDRALAAGVPTARIGRELLRQRAICACALGDADAMGRIREQLDGEGSPFAGSSGGRRAWVMRLLARCGQNR